MTVSKRNRIAVSAKGRFVAWALVNAADFAWLNQWRWCLHTRGYVCRSVWVGGKCQVILMHRLILGLEHGDKRQGEHENRNKLDNQRSNLRIAPRGDLDNRQNLDPYANNTSGHRGVSWNKANRRWVAHARLGGKRHNLGSFATPEEADRVVKAWRAVHMPFSEDAALAGITHDSRRHYGLVV
jgi:hypothetical protein